VDWVELRSTGTLIATDDLPCMQVLTTAIGWSCVPQTTPGGTYTRTPEQEQLYLHVLQELPIWISHKLTTIYQIHDQQV
jgi:hypothetical protein